MGNGFEFNVQVGAILVRYSRCTHCGSVPTEKQIEEQISIVQREYGDPCVVCSKRAKVTEIFLRHSKETDVDRWGGEVLAMDRVDEICGTIGKDYYRLKVHERCAAKAMPFSRIPGSKYGSENKSQTLVKT